MGIMGMISEKMNAFRAEKAGISPDKWQKYESKRKKELFIEEQKATRKAEIKYIKEKQKLKVQNRLEGLKIRQEVPKQILKGIQQKIKSDKNILIPEKKASNPFEPTGESPFK